MPLYDYRCTNGHRFEVLQKFADDPIEVCEVCGAPAVRVLHPVAIHFKGSGFYNTDYGKGGKKKPSSDGGKGKSSSDSSSKSSESSSSSSSGDSKKSDSGSSSSRARPAPRATPRKKPPTAEISALVNGAAGPVQRVAWRRAAAPACPGTCRSLGVLRARRRSRPGRRSAAACRPGGTAACGPARNLTQPSSRNSLAVRSVVSGSAIALPMRRQVEDVPRARQLVAERGHHPLLALGAGDVGVAAGWSCGGSAHRRARGAPSRWMLPFSKCQ